jgi:hypothetical protein
MVQIDPRSTVDPHSLNIRTQKLTSKLCSVSNCVMLGASDYYAITPAVSA